VSGKDCIPPFVYLVTVDTEWPISAILDDHPTLTAMRVEDEVTRRRRSTNVARPEQVRVWKARLVDIHEVDLLLSTTVGPSLCERKLPAPDSTLRPPDTGIIPGGGHFTVEHT
jgi:hypothetical protein